MKDSESKKENDLEKVDLQTKKRELYLEQGGEIYKNKLLKSLVENKPYLKSDIKLLDIAIELYIAPHILSNVINKYFHMNYFDLINSYRVKYAGEMLLDSKYSNYNILAIAFESGFNSKSSFNRIFKKHTGLTPTEYQNQKLSS